MLILLLCACRWPKVMAVFLGAGCFFASLSWQYQQQQLASSTLLEQNHIVLLVKINATPKVYAQYSQFSATVLSGPARGYQLTLRWQQPPLLAAGQHWRLRLRLKPLHGMVNPGGFNITTYGWVNGLLAQGQVSKGPHILLQQQYSLRQLLLERVERAISPYATAPLLKALAVGERDFSARLWLGAQHSGLGHLLAISGLHIGLVFGWVLWLASCSKGVLAIARQHQLALLLALGAALFYAWLASFAIPTVRASVALALLVICRSQLARLSLGRFWLVLVSLLLLVQPFWVLSASFWLSVLAVAIIFIVLWRYPLTQYHWRARLIWFLRFHLLLSVMMTLLTIVLFSGFSPVVLLSNLIFVPWCSLVAIPLLLLSLLLTLSGVSDVTWLWQLTDLAFRPLLWWLHASADEPLWWPMRQVSGVMVSLLTMVLLLAFLFIRKAMLILIPLSVLLLSGSALQVPTWQLHLLESGQRQVVLLQRGSRALLYDAAPALAIQDIAARQLEPVLRQLGIRQLDYLLFRQQRTERQRQWRLLADYPVRQNNLDSFSQQGGVSSCQQLPAWYHDIQIEVLVVPASDHCILRVTVAGWRLFIPGIIDRATEQILLADSRDLTAEVMLLANNGSAAVNSLSLLQRVNPSLALNAAAFMNGYQHPAQAVQQRLALLGVPLLNTAEYGAISIRFKPNKLEVSSWQRQRLPFWVEKPPAIAETLVTTR